MIDFRLHVTLGSTPGPTAVAGDRLDRVLERWSWGSTDARAAARTVAGELVADALARAGTAAEVSMLLACSGRRLRIAVTVGSATAPSTAATPPAHAAQWGTTSHPGGGTTVWCELVDLPAPRRPDRAERLHAQHLRLPAA